MQYYWVRLNQILYSFSESMVVAGRDLIDVLFSLILAVIIAIIISQIYRHTHRGMNFELTFMATLVLLAPIVAVVMLFIRGDLVLSLGLIGSLSIIRFRTPIKDTRDMVFLFWVIAVGLGCGTYNWMIVIISTIFITIVMFALYFIKYGRSQNTDFVLVVSGAGSFDDDRVDKLVKKYTEEARIRSHEVEDGQWEIIYELRFSRVLDQVTKRIIKDLDELEGVQKVSLLAPQLALPV